MGDNPQRNSDSVPTRAMVDEISDAIIVRERAQKAQSIWQTIGSGLAIVIATATVAGVLGKAFFVPQSEYNARLQADLVSQEAFRQTMSRLDHSISELANVSSKMVETVQDLKTDLAVVRATRQK